MFSWFGSARTKLIHWCEDTQRALQTQIILSQILFVTAWVFQGKNSPFFGRTYNLTPIYFRVWGWFLHRHLRVKAAYIWAQVLGKVDSQGFTVQVWNSKVWICLMVAATPCNCKFLGWLTDETGHCCIWMLQQSLYNPNFFLSDWWSYCCPYSFPALKQWASYTNFFGVISAHFVTSPKLLSLVLTEFSWQQQPYPNSSAELIFFW